MLDRCTHWINTEGNTTPLDEDIRRRIKHSITTMASCGLRTLALALRDFDHVPEGLTMAPEEDMTLLCVVGIKVGCSSWGGGG